MSILSKYISIILLSTFILFAMQTDNNSSKDTNASSKNQFVIALKKSLKKKPYNILKNLPYKKTLTSFYRKNNYLPIWYKNDKLNKAKYTQLFVNIENDITLNQKGLIYKNYKTLNQEVDNNLTQAQALRLEVRLTSLYHNFLIHAIYGEIEWKNFSYKLSSLKRRKINAAWVKKKAKFNIPEIIKDDNITENLKAITPKHFGYQGLLEALRKLEVLKKEGAWEKLPYFKKLSLGSSGDIVLKLRSRLKVSGDYQECNETNTSAIIKNDQNESLAIKLDRDAVFGHCLEKAVKIFQTRHALLADGIVGAGTRKTLNMDIDKKIHKVRLNIDRIKWLPREESERYVVVNIPEFMLHYIENKERKQSLRVIVGDRKHPTPIFSQNISFVVLNPYWKVPEGIVKREIVPAMIKNPNYLKKQGLVAHRTWDERSAIIDTSWLYWEEYLDGQKRFPYRLMQPPGPRNALGKIKFKFPNRFSVYLHDTPTRYLFKRRIRAFSHGCVRLSKPRSFLETLATFNPNIDIRKAKKTLKGKRKKLLSLNSQLRIHIIYLTVGLDKEGNIQFYNDIYKYDKYQKRRIR